MARLTTCRRCGSLIDLQARRDGNTCEVCAVDRNYGFIRASDHDAMYRDGKWTNLSRLIKNRYNGFDVYEYYLTGKLVPSQVVHHVIPVSEDEDLRYDINNLIPLTRGNHLRVENFYTNIHNATIIKKELNNALLHWAKVFWSKSK